MNACWTPQPCKHIPSTACACTSNTPHLPAEMTRTAHHTCTSRLALRLIAAQIVMNTMAEFDLDGDNMLDFSEFKMLLST